MIALAPTASACVACRTRDCCRDRDVPLTGADVARIATVLEVAPITFAALAAPGPDAPPDTTFFGPDRQRAHLVLQRRPEPDGRTACVFLLALGSRRRTCGLGALAPLGCRLYPSSEHGPGSCWRHFTPDEVADARAELAARHTAERRAWHDFLRTTEALVTERPHPLDLETLLDALLAADAGVFP